MPRPRGKPIKLFVNDAERKEITLKAESANLSQSAYCRAAALNHKIRSVLDVQAVQELAKVNGDLGRVAGLLKLWLATKRGEGAPPMEVERMMKEFRVLQKKCHEIMGGVIR